MAFTVSSGHTSTGLTLSGKFVGGLTDTDFGYVFSGGTASDTLVAGLGDLEVSAKGVATGTVVSSQDDYADARLNVQSGGRIFGTKMGPQANVTISAGAVADSTFVSISSEGSIGISQIANLTVLAGGSALDTTLTGNEFEFLVVEGVASNVLVSALSIDGGAELIVSSGGYASGVKEFHGAAIVASGGSVASISDAGGELAVFAGGSATAVVLGHGDGNSTVFADGGTVSGLNLTSAQGEIEPGGVARVVAVGDSATLFVEGSAGAVAVAEGGTIEVTSVVDGLSVASGALLELRPGSVISHLSMGTGAILMDESVELGGGQTLIVGGPIAAFTASTLNGPPLSDVNSTLATSVTRQSVEEVRAGGFTLLTSVTAGGQQLVRSGGFASDSIVRVGGWQTVIAGGSAVSSFMSGGVQWVRSGATVIGAALSAGGQQIISSGGVSEFAVVGSQGIDIVRGLSLQATVSSGGKLDVQFGGVAISTSLVFGGVLTVQSGGAAVSTTVTVKPGFSGSMLVSSGGVAQGVDLTLGGALTVLAGGVASGVTASGNSPDGDGAGSVTNGGRVVGAVLGGGDAMTVLAGGVASGSVIDSGGTVAVSSGGTLVNAVISGAGTVVLSAGAIDTMSISFVSSGGTLAWGGQGSLGAKLAGFGLGDTVDLTALAFTTSGTATFGTQLNVTEGGKVDHIHFFGSSFAGSTWQLSSDGHGGTDVTLAAMHTTSSVWPGSTLA